jgi:hypothetical protein
MPKPSPKLDPVTDAVLRRMLATAPQPLGVVKARSVREAKRKPRATAGLKLNGEV